MKRLVLLSVLALILLGCNPGPETPRGGPAFDGSARWAFNIAQPRISGFAADAQLYHVQGAMMMKDGRLFANQGNWGFVTWSPTQNQIFSVTVDYNGAVTTSTRAATSPPASASGLPLPATWANSTDAFAVVAPHLSGSVSKAQLVVLNLVSYSQAPHQAVWAINFDVPPNQLVRWDGTYIGHQ